MVEQPEATEQSASPVTGIVYVLANSAMPDYVKIGTTQDLQERMRTLDGTSVPWPFECVYAAKVENPRKWEQTLHEVFSEARVNRRREFFRSEVTAKVVLILQTAQLEDVTRSVPPTVSDEETKQIGRRENFDFAMLDIAVGEKLQFYSDERVVCTITRQKPPRVSFGDEDMTATAAAAKALLRDSSSGIQGPLYWNYKDESLVERRNRMEREAG